MTPPRAMHLNSHSLRTIAWSTLAFTTAHAQYIIENLSFGHKDGAYISSDLMTVPNFVIQGSGDYVPQVLSDRILLTPPYPGNMRGSIWAQQPLHHSGDWTAEIDFRATGMERGAGNLQIWYVKDSQAHETPTSLYTAHKFDGLVLVIDQYEGHGGSVRGFLNDGKIDIKAHPDPDTLAFGKCDYAYRNRGELTPIKLHHADGFFEVIVDGASCFKTDKVHLPEGYYFGISASSAENPDSFEIHKLIVSTRDEPNKQHKQEDPVILSHHLINPVQHKPLREPEKHDYSKLPPHHGSSNNDIPKVLEDMPAASIHNQQEQFADLHNRVQILNNYMLDMLDLMDEFEHKMKQRFTEVMARVGSIDDRGAATIRDLEKVERNSMQILRDLESKDFKDVLNSVHTAIENSHDGLRRSLPLHLGAAVEAQRPNMIKFLFMAVAVQIMVTGAYMLYKKRRAAAPKKYL